MSTHAHAEGTIPVLIAHDQQSDRGDLRQILETLQGVEVVAEARDSQQALELLGRTRARVALVDVGMPSVRDGDPIRHIRDRHDGVRAVALSGSANEEHILRALQSGACGFLLRDARRDELEVAVRAAARGESFLCPSIAREVIEAYVQRLEANHAPTDRITARQREVLQRVVEGRTSKEIARELGLSVKTVESHRAEIMRRLGVRHMAELVREAVRMGLLPDEREH